MHLPSARQVAQGLLGFDVAAKPGPLLRSMQAWAKGLGFTRSGGDTVKPWVNDLWIWLPLGVVAVGETRETGRYYVHCGTGRIFDAVTGQWCLSNWVPRKNTPRVSVQWLGGNIRWTQLGQLLALTGDAPRGGPGSGGQQWTVAAEPAHAAFLREHELSNGAGTGCIDVLSAMRWVRIGRPADGAVTYPFMPRPECRVMSLGL